MYVHVHTLVMYVCMLSSSMHNHLVFPAVVKVLTLASNERVPLTPSMRLMFEIGHVKAATPATVSRAGILFVNPNDLGWNP